MTLRHLARFVPGSGVYQTLSSGQISVFNNWNDLPAEYDELVEFNPSIPPSPHTEKEHEYISGLNEQFKLYFNRARWRTNPPTESSPGLTYYASRN
jgi:hypothetical protein